MDFTNFWIKDEQEPAYSVGFLGTQGYLYRGNKFDYGPSQDYTISCWVKSTSDNNGTVFSFGNNLSTTVAGGLGPLIAHGNPDPGQFGAYPQGSDNGALICDGEQRDTAAWYHLVYSSAGGNTKLYINGTRRAVDSRGGTLAPTNSWMVIGGALNYPSENYITGWKGNIADFYFIGDDVDREEFGYFNDDKVWVPKAYEGTYGPDDFYLDFSDSSDLGADRTGNGNNFQMIASSSLRHSTDHPTNNGARFQANVIFSQKPELPAPILTDTNLRASSPASGSNDPAAMATHAIPDEGKYYFEFKPQQLFTTGFGCGINSQAYQDFNNSRELRYTANGRIYRGWDTRIDGVATYGAGDVIGFHVDMDNAQVEIFKNNVSVNPPINIPPPSFGGINQYFPYYNGNDGDDVSFIPGNTKDFTYNPPAGYKTLTTADMWPVTVKNGRDHFVTVLEEGEGPLIFIPIADDTTPTTAFVQDQWTYLGSTPFSRQAGNFTIDLGGSVTTTDFTYSSSSSGVEVLLSLDGTTWRSLGDQVTSGTKTWTDGDPFRFVRHYVNAGPAGYTLGLTSVTNNTASPVLFVAQQTFPNGLWWIKDRQYANQHQLVDSGLKPSGSPWRALTCPSLNPPEINYTAPAGSSLAWCWKLDNNQQQNTDGTIEVTTMTNKAAGFSMLNYAGTGSAGTIGHGLDQKPDFIIMKARDINDENWIVYYGNNTDYLRLNSNVAKFSSTTLLTDVTDEHIAVSTNTSNNGAGSIYRMYCWHSVPGYSKFGTYKGSGDANGPYIYTGFRPAWVMVKNINYTGGWVIHDTRRSPVNPVGNLLNAENTEAETVFARFDYYSNGFKVTSTWGASNTAGEQVLYMAFAENPFGGSNVAPSNAR